MRDDTHLYARTTVTDRVILITDNEKKSHLADTDLCYLNMQ